MSHREELEPLGGALGEALGQLAQRGAPLALKPIWLQAAGATRVDAMHGPVFTDGMGAYHAMKAGLGIALMRRSFIAQELADGTLAGSMLTLERGVANFAAWAKVPLADAVRSATEVPAHVIGLSSTRGRISRGRDADLTAFDSEHRLLWTMVGGALHEPAAA